MSVGGRGRQASERERESVWGGGGLIHACPVQSRWRRWQCGVKGVCQCPCAHVRSRCGLGLGLCHRRCVCSSVYLLRTLQHPQVSQWHNGVGLHSGLAAPVPQSSPKIRHSEFTCRTNIHKNLLLQMYAVKRRITWFKNNNKKFTRNNNNNLIKHKIFIN